MKVLFHARNCEWLGVEYLMAGLLQDGHEVELAFDCGVGDQDIRIPWIARFLAVEKTLRHKARTFRPDLIASCVLTNTWSAARETYRLFHQECSAPIVVGGPHATAAPMEILADPEVSAVCIGEGDSALREFCAKAARGESCIDVLNFWLKDGGGIKKNPLRPLIPDLDALPLPYKDPFYEHGTFRHRSYLMAGRGCPFRCTFCSSGYYQKLYGNPAGYVRRHSVERVIEMCRSDMDRFPIREFFFYDETFILDESWVVDFSQRYRTEIALPFKVLLRPGTFKGKTLARLKRAGLLYVDVGVETGNERIRREVLGKNIDNKTILESCALIKEAGIGLTLLLMVGCPKETKEHMEETYRMVSRIRPDGVVMHYFYPFLGTPAWDMALQEGWITKENEAALRQGQGGYREASTLLNNPFKEAARKWFLIMPFCAKLPPWTHPLLMRLPLIAPVRILSSFLTSIPRNVWFRFKEFMRMLYTQWRLAARLGPPPAATV